MKFLQSPFLLAVVLLSPALYSQTTGTDSVEIDGKVFVKVDEEASFPGGTGGWRKYLESNLNPSVPVDNSAPVGEYTVWVQFLVSTDGSLSDIKALTKLGYGMETEVLRIIRKSGKWNPAIYNGMPVKAYRKQPVTFVVMDASFNVITEKRYTFYTDTDNEMTIDAGKVKASDLVVSLSQGKLTKVGDNQYIVNVNKPGRVLLTIINGKKNKPVGVVSFEVLPKQQE